jgi:hypothetical protein
LFRNNHHTYDRSPQLSFLKSTLCMVFISFCSIFSNLVPELLIQLHLSPFLVVSRISFIIMMFFSSFNFLSFIRIFFLAFHDPIKAFFSCLSFKINHYYVGLCEFISLMFSSRFWPLSCLLGLPLSLYFFSGLILIIMSFWTLLSGTGIFYWTVLRFTLYIALII